MSTSNDTTAIGEDEGLCSFRTDIVIQRFERNGKAAYRLIRPGGIVFELHDADFQVARALDGRRSAVEVALALRVAGLAIAPAQVIAVYRELLAMGFVAPQGEVTARAPAPDAEPTARSPAPVAEPTTQRAAPPRGLDDLDPGASSHATTQWGASSGDETVDWNDGATVVDPQGVERLMQRGPLSIESDRVREDPTNELPTAIGRSLAQSRPPPQSLHDTETRPRAQPPRPPPSTSRPPPSTSRPPPSTSRPPPSASRPPPSASRPPPSASRPPPALLVDPPGPGHDEPEYPRFEAPMPGNYPRVRAAFDAAATGAPTLAVEPLHAATPAVLPAAPALPGPALIDLSSPRPAAQRKPSLPSLSSLPRPPWPVIAAAGGGVLLLILVIAMIRHGRNTGTPPARPVAVAVPPPVATPTAPDEAPTAPAATFAIEHVAHPRTTLTAPADGAVLASQLDMVRQVAPDERLFEFGPRGKPGREIRAPFAGRATPRVKRGAEVGRGGPLAELVDESTWQIEGHFPAPEVSTRWICRVRLPDAPAEARCAVSQVQAATGDGARVTVRLSTSAAPWFDGEHAAVLLSPPR